jgi:hypothetical protein
MNSADRVKQMAETAREQIAKADRTRHEVEIEQGILAAMISDRDKNMLATHGE